MNASLPCLPLIQERFWNKIKEEFRKENPKYRPEFELTVFLQTWGDTSLGFGGIGGQMITSAYTTVIREEYTGWAGVFFGEQFAYAVRDPNPTFFEDVQKFCMKPVREHGEYVKETN